MSGVSLFPKAASGSPVPDGGYKTGDFRGGAITLCGDVQKLPGNHDVCTYASWDASPTVGARIKYLSSFFALLTVGGAMGQQLKEIASGRDPANMADPVFWAKAALTGGGLGYLGDFFLSNLNRYGSGLPNMLAGPVVALLSDVRNLRSAISRKYWREKTRILQKSLPLLAAKFITGIHYLVHKIAVASLIADWLFKEADPQGYKKLRRAEKRLLRETGQEYWWRPGQTARIACRILRPL